jgi:hypothetical protein
LGQEQENRQSMIGLSLCGLPGFCVMQLWDANSRSLHAMRESLLPS